MGGGDARGAVLTTAVTWTDYLGGAQAAPWLWWAFALVVLLALLVGMLKLMGLFPE